jgi:hypothetical protein
MRTLLNRDQKKTQATTRSVFRTGRPFSLTYWVEEDGKKGRFGPAAESIVTVVMGWNTQKFGLCENCALLLYLWSVLTLIAICTYIYMRVTSTLDTYVENT